MMNFGGFSSSSNSIDLSSPTKPEPISAPIAPYLSKPVAPFAGRSRRRRAATGAIFYAECSLQGITPKEADDAAKESETHFQKWWLQHRFKASKTPAGEDRQEDNSILSNGRKRRRSQFDNRSTGSGKRAALPASEEEQEHQRQIGGAPTADRNDHSSLCPSGGLVAREVRDEQQVTEAKDELLSALTDNDGQPTGERFLAALEELKTMYSQTGIDVRESPEEMEHCLDGVWLTLSKPNYHECLGKNAAGEYKYSLGRMSFDMFRPTHLVCSIQGVFNPVFVTKTIPDAVPRSLRKEIQAKSCTLRTYNIVTAFTIDPEDENRPPLQGVMTTYGYILPDPSVPNRLSVWFTGGVLEANEDSDAVEWERVFGGDLPKRMLKERARLLAAKLLLGASVPECMEEDGSMSYYLKRPIGGHGVVYIEVLYLDDTLRIMRGQHGSIYVMSRVPPNETQE